MTANQQLTVDAIDLALRLECKCGAAVVVKPSEILNDAIFLCPNCLRWWPNPIVHAVNQVIGGLGDLQALAAGGDGKSMESYKILVEVAR